MAGQGGFGTTIVGGTTLTSVAEVVKISLPELGMTDLDVSSMDSANNFMEFVGGSTDPGQIDIELNYDKTQDNAILSAYGSANDTWTITFPDASSWATKGYINKMGGGVAGTNEKIGRVLGIKCSGVPTHATS